METYSPLLFNIFAIIIFCGFGCLQVTILGLAIILFVKKLPIFREIITAQFQAPPAEDFLASAALYPWDPGAFKDISCHWKGHWHTLTWPLHREVFTRGVIQSTRQPNGPGWLAFTIDSELHNNFRNDLQPERKGLIILKTSEHRIELKVRGQHLDANMHVQAWLDGIEWGSMTVTNLACLYRNSEHAIEARWAPGLDSRRIYLFNKPHSLSQKYYPLIVNDRPIAALPARWIRDPRHGAKNPISAALQSISDELGTHESNVLLMMIGMSLYFDSFRRPGIAAYN